MWSICLFIAYCLVNSTGNQMVEYYHPPNITEIRRLIAKHNELQLVLNEYVFGPLQNDSVIIVVQVSINN